MNPDLGAVSARLASAARRARFNLALDAAARGAAAGAGLFVFLEAVRRILPDGFRRMMDAVGLGAVEVPLRQSVIASIVVAAIAGLWILLATLPRTPGATGLAQRADRAFGLRERLSTALEVAGSAGSGPIRAALLRDAAARSGAIDVRALTPFRLPPPVWLLAIFLATGLVLQLAPVTLAPQSRAASSVAGPAAPLPALAADDRAALAAEVRRAAEAIRAQAEAAGDATIEGVGRTLERLGDDIAAGEAFDRAAIAAELGALAEFAAATPAAPAPDAPVAAATAAAAIEALLAAVQPAAQVASPQLTAGRGDGDGTAVEPLFDADHQPPTVVGRTAERGIGDGTRQAPSERMQGNVGGIQVQLGNEWEDDDVVNEARAGGTARPNAAAGNLGVETAAQPGQRTATGPGLGDDPPPNGGTQRTEMAGETPGAGVQADAGLPYIPAEPLEYEIDHGMELAGAVNPEGRRIQLDIPPTPQEAGAADMAPEAAAAWRLTPEAAIARLMLDPAARDLVARYFAGLAPTPVTP